MSSVLNVRWNSFHQGAEMVVHKLRYFSVGALLEATMGLPGFPGL